jgi:hypothetical protein
MRRLVFVSLIVVVAACGSDSHQTSAPSQTLTGTWKGELVQGPDTAVFTLTAAQNGSALNGVGIEDIGHSPFQFEFSGASAPPDLSLVLDYGATFLLYTGSFVTADSIAGSVTNGENTFPLAFVRQ